MEATGLVVGFVGLAGLFSACVNCFKLVRVYHSRNEDYDLLQTMLDNQQFLMAWGRACGFRKMETSNPRFDGHDPVAVARNTRIETTLDSIQALLTNTDRLKAKYGLRPQTGTGCSFAGRS